MRARTTTRALTSAAWATQLKSLLDVINIHIVGIIMGLFETRRPLNVAMIGLHVGLQLVVGYWAVVIDGYQCQEQSIQNVTYFGYSLIVFNLLAYALFKSRSQPQYFSFVEVIINLGLLAGILYFTINGFNRYNNCAASRVLY